MNDITKTTATSERQLNVLTRIASDQPLRWSVDVVAPLQTNDSLTDAEWREKRHHNQRQGQLLRTDHRAFYSEKLMHRRAANATSSVAKLLQDLSETWGVGWSDIAKMLGVSVPALRKWRKNENGATPENHQRLAGLVTFYEVLAEHVGSPVSWVLMPLADGFNVSARDVYSESNAAKIIDHAAGNVGAVELLDELDPSWRSTYRSEYDVFIAGDGQPSLYPRGRQQK
jgi:hypothetical protein